MRIFISHILPKDQIMRYHLSVAGCNFSWALIEGGVFDKVYSIAPPSVSGRLNFEYPDLIYSKLRYLKNKRLRKLSRVIEQIIVFKKIPKDASVWFYNISSLNFILYALIRYFRRSSQANVIMLDCTPNHKKMSFLSIFFYLCNQAHGVITLSDSDLFRCKNRIVVPGVVPDNAVDHKLVSDVTPKFLLTGNINEGIAMIRMLLEAFSLMPECELHITGFVEDSNIIESFTRKYTNIKYYGRLSYTEYEKLLEEIPFLLSTRNPAYPENQCNFPSKIIEALLYNRIVISTIKYSQLGDVKYLYISSTLSEFIEGIRNILQRKANDILSYANQGQLVREKFNTKVWKTYLETIENEGN